LSERSTAPLDRERILSAFRVREIAPACLAFVLTFSVYLFTLAPTITFGDSGELATAAHTLGIAHPPGYPLWLIMGKFFSFIPLGDVAYRLNLMSALLGAAAIGILTIVISRTIPVVCAGVISREAFESPVAGMIVGSAAVTAALILAFSPSFWHQSVIGEVYALNSFLVCLLLLLLVLWSENPEKNGLLFAISFIFGSGLGNHQTLLLMGPALAAFGLLIRPRIILSPKVMLGCFGLFVLGLCFYAYLPLRAAALPPINWGDPSSWENFWFHFTRKQYRAIEVIRPLSVFMPQIKFFFASIAAESLMPILLVPALLTLGFRGERGMSWLIFTMASFFCTGIVFVVINNTELDLNAQDILIVYFLPAYTIVAIWLGYGIGIIGLLALRASKRLRLRPMPVTLVAALWLIVPLSSLALNYDRAAMRKHDFARMYGEELMIGLRHGSLLLVGTDSAYAVPMYLKWVEGYRPDISILTINRLSDGKYAAEAQRNAPEREFFSSKDYEEAVSAVGAGAAVGGSISGSGGSGHLMRINGYLAWKLLRRSETRVYYDEGVPIEGLRDFAIPSGLAMELKPERIESISDDTVASDRQYWDDLEARLFASKFFLVDRDARQKFSKCRSNIGALYLHHKMYAEAEAALNQAVRFSDRNMEAYAYLALLRREQGRVEEAVGIFGDYMRRDPWNTSARGFYEGLKK
jgi:tetratricopeptide (TPR) repeat protein